MIVLHSNKLNKKPLKKIDALCHTSRCASLMTALHFAVDVSSAVRNASRADARVRTKVPSRLVAAAKRRCARGIATRRGRSPAFSRALRVECPRQAACWPHIIVHTVSTETGIAAVKVSNHLHQKASWW